MAEKNIKPFKEHSIRTEGAFTVVETTALGLATMAMIVAFEASRVGERLKLPGAETVRGRLERVLYTSKE